MVTGRVQVFKIVPESSLLCVVMFPGILSAGFQVSAHFVNGISLDAIVPILLAQQSPILEDDKPYLLIACCPPLVNKVFYSSSGCLEYCLFPDQHVNTKGRHTPACTFSLLVLC
jgi:hypothetical protein